MAWTESERVAGLWYRKWDLERAITRWESGEQGPEPGGPSKEEALADLRQRLANVEAELDRT